MIFSKNNTYNTIDNRILYGGPSKTLKVSNVDMCKRLCDRFDDCKGFTHEQIGDICQFYGPAAKLRLDYHVGHMAAFLKSGESQDPYDFFREAINRIEVALNMYDEAESAKREFNYYIRRKISAKESHEKGELYNNAKRNYTILNPITNVSYKNSTPETSYNSIDEINFDMYQLSENYSTSALDFENILTAHDTLVIIFDQLESQIANDYVEHISQAVESARLIIDQQKFLLKIMNNYKYFILLKKILNELHGELDSSVNEIVETGNGLLKNFVTLTPQAIKAKHERIEEQYQILMGRTQKIKKMQQILFKFDETQIGKYDQNMLIKENNDLIESVFSAMEMYSYLHESLAMSTKKEHHRKTVAACDDKMYEKINTKSIRFDDFSSHTVPQMPLVLKKSAPQVIVRDYEGEYIKFIA